jgi:hypothetical protein
MTEPTKEQIQMLLIFCGIQSYSESIADENIAAGIIAWIQPPNSEKTIPYYGLTLDFLFKWAVPKLVEKLSSAGKYYKIRKVYRALELAILNDKDPALALFWAIMEVIDG